MAKFNDILGPVEYNGTELARSSKVGTCWHCGQPTYWVDTNFMAHLCSEECTDARWKEYEDAVRASSP